MGKIVGWSNSVIGDDSRNADEVGAICGEGRALPDEMNGRPEDGGLECTESKIQCGVEERLKESDAEREALTIARSSSLFRSADELDLIGAPEPGIYLAAGNNPIVSENCMIGREACSAEPHKLSIIRAIEKLTFAWVTDEWGCMHYDISRSESDIIKVLIKQTSTMKDIDYIQITLALLETCERRFAEYDQTHPVSRRKSSSPNLERLISFIEKESQKVQACLVSEEPRR